MKTKMFIFAMAVVTACGYMCYYSGQAQSISSELKIENIEALAVDCEIRVDNEVVAICEGENRTCHEETIAGVTVSCSGQKIGPGEF